MDTTLTKLGLFSLLLASTSFAFAFPLIQFGGRADNHPNLNPPNLNLLTQREDRQPPRQLQHQEERRERGEMRRGLPPAGDANARGENAGRDAQAQSKNSRLSAEERRALRRQINEAGQDIYPNKK